MYVLFVCIVPPDRAFCLYILFVKHRFVKSRKNGRKVEKIDMLFLLLLVFIQVITADTTYFNVNL